MIYGKLLFAYHQESCYIFGFIPSGFFSNLDAFFIVLGLRKIGFLQLSGLYDRMLMSYVCMTYTFKALSLNVSFMYPHNFL